MGIDFKMRYNSILWKNNEKLFASIRPRVQSNIRLSKKGMERNSVKYENNCIEDLLKEIYCYDIDGIKSLSLTDIVAIKRAGDYFFEKFANRTLTKAEYQNLSSIAREFYNTCGCETLKKML